MKQNVAAKVYSLLEKSIVKNGFYIWDITYGKEAGEMLLTVTVDKNSEDGKTAEISLDMLSDLNEIINDILDANDPIPEAYSLMLESAGAERALRTDEHINYAISKNATVELKLYKAINISFEEKAEEKAENKPKSKAKGKNTKNEKKDFVGKIIQYKDGVITFEAEIKEEAEKGKTVNKSKGEKAFSLRKEILTFEKKQISKLIAYV